MNDDEGIDERPAPRLEPIRAGRGGLPLGLGLLALALAVAFLTGLGLGARVAPAPSPNASPAPSASPSPTPAPLAGAQVSRALWIAYLDRGFSGPSQEGWALCRVAAEIACRPILAVPDTLLDRFELLPGFVPPQDWSAFSAVTVPPGHYVLAAPMTRLGPEVSLASIAADGGGTLIGPAEQATWNAILWADLGTLATGRYAAVVVAYSLPSYVPQGPSTTELVGWGLGFAVSP